MKAKANLRKRTANAKKNKRKSKIPDDRYSYDRDDNEPVSEQSPRKQDSVYAFTGDSKKQIIWLVFSKESNTKDSLSYFYLEEKNDISADDKNNLDNYLKVNGTRNIEEILIKGLLRKDEHNDHAGSVTKYRSKKIIRFLTDCGVDKSHIRIEKN